MYCSRVPKISRKIVCQSFYTFIFSRINRLKDDGSYLKDNFDVEVEKWALECLGLVGLGTRLGCLNDKLTPEAQELIYCAKVFVQKTFQLDFFPKFWKYIPTPSYKKLMKVFDKQWE